MKKTGILTFVFLAALFASYGPVAVYAEEKDKPAAAVAENEKAAEDAAAKVRSDYKEKIKAATSELGESFNEEQTVNMGRIRGNFGIIRAIKIMKHDIGDAVKRCGDANADMEDAMTKRFSAWDKTVAPLLKEDEKNLEESITKSSFPDEKKVRSYLSLIDDAAEESDKALGEKQVITTPESCQYLMTSLDKSEPMVVSLLNGIKWPMLGDAIEEEPAAEPAEETKKEEKPEDKNGDKAE